MIAEPIYFYLEVWKDKAANTSPGQLPSMPANDNFVRDARSEAYVPPNESRTGVDLYDYQYASLNVYPIFFLVIWSLFGVFIAVMSFV